MLKSSLLEGLNEAQCEAVIHGEGPALVVAGPGSGKTLTIIRRILYLIYVHRVPAHKILVITYTKDAALSMAERFYQELKQVSFKEKNFSQMVSFGTFHSCFYQIIKKISKYSDYQLITQQEKHKILEEIMKAKGLTDISDYNLRNILENISYFKNTESFKNQDEWVDLFAQYEVALHKYGRMDFDDMLFWCKKEFSEDKNLLNKCREQFDYILIDEYQDINPVQYELVNFLMKEKKNLFVVGDDDQAIYGFRGSDGACFQKILRDYENVKIIYLNINYRCGKRIVDAAGKLISNNQNRMHKDMMCGALGNVQGEIIEIGCHDLSDCYEKMVIQLSAHNAEQLENQAVLFRTNASLQSFANKLSYHQIPYVIREKIISIYDHFIAKDIFDYFMASHGCNDRKLYLRIFHKNGLSVVREVLSEEQVDLKKVKKIFTTGFYENKNVYEKLVQLENHLKRLSKMRPALGLQYILHGMNYEQYLTVKAGKGSLHIQEWKDILDYLKMDAQLCVNFSEWMDIKNRTRENPEKFGGIKKGKKGGIHLMTLHASKGLEFDKVYMINLNEGHIPNIKRGESVTRERIEEERRLFYVALTRAKQAVYLYYVTGSTEKPKFRSRFLDELV